MTTALPLRSASRYPIATDALVADVSRSLAALLASIIATIVLSGCAIRQDSTGTTRVGIGLWGFGDPPGVDWNLDRPGREIPELPTTRSREVPELPRTRALDGDLSAKIRRTQAEDDHGTEPSDGGVRRIVSIDDNRGCAVHDASVLCF